MFHDPQRRTFNNYLIFRLTGRNLWGILRVATLPQDQHGESKMPTTTKDPDAMLSDALGLLRQAYYATPDGEFRVSRRGLLELAEEIRKEIAKAVPA